MQKLPAISDQLVRFMNNEMNDNEKKRLLRRLNIKHLKGPEPNGYMGGIERMKIFNALLNLENDGTG